MFCCSGDHFLIMSKFWHEICRPSKFNWLELLRGDGATEPSISGSYLTALPAWLRTIGKQLSKLFSYGPILASRSNTRKFLILSLFREASEKNPDSIFYMSISNVSSLNLSMSEGSPNMLVLNLEPCLMFEKTLFSTLKFRWMTFALVYGILSTFEA